MIATTTVPERGMRGAAKLIFMRRPDLLFPMAAIDPRRF
jgi:hypothetical protein